jgi:thiamine-phosphate pyrophosphorylase
VAEAVAVPVVAIGGVTEARVSALLAAGAHGVAVVSAIAAAPDPADATRRLLAATGQATRPVTGQATRPVTGQATGHAR